MDSTKLQSYIEMTQNRFESIPVYYSGQRVDMERVARDYDWLIENFKKLLTVTKDLEKFLKQQLEVSGKCCYTKASSHVDAAAYLEGLQNDKS